MSANISSIQDEYDADQSNCPLDNCDWWYEQMGQSTCDGDYPDWIEIYNPGTESIDLTGYGLSDNPTNPYKWTFPKVTLTPQAYLLVFASGKDRKIPRQVGDFMHTNFKIEQLGETLILTDAAGNTCDSINTSEIPIDFSLGRYPDGAQNWVIFNQPTPTQSNVTPPFPGFTDAVQTSHSAGFYHGAISLSLSASSPTAEIRYTLNGDEPTMESSLYANPISIANTTIVKARTFENGMMSSRLLIQTYFINENFSMPVISLSTPPANLWDDAIGIYVPGNDADEGNRVANYWQDWERPVHVELFEPNGSLGFSIDAGIKIFGWGSRGNELKSLSIMIRDKYGLDKLHYPLFPNLPLTEFSAFILRTAGNDWQGTYFRDPLCTSLIKTKNLDTQAFRPAIVFINGEYWGIHNIQEKLNEDYLADHHGVDKDNLDIISRYWRRDYPVIIEGDDQAYLELEDYLESHSLSNPKYYEHIKTKIDVDNYLDYLVTEIFIANYDWPGNNNKCWRPRTPNGQWRWLTYDLDWTFSFDENASYNRNILEHATNPFGFSWPNPAFTTFLNRKLFESEQFRNDFINRSADCMNTIFLPDTVLAKIEQMKWLFEPEMERHIGKWGSFVIGTLTSMSDWENNIEVLREFARKRAPYVRQHIRDKFNLKGWKELQLNISKDDAGIIKLNSIIVNQFPWHGDYFLGVPITLTALPNAGYRFSHWTGISSADSLSRMIIIQLSNALSVTAHFEEDEHSSYEIVINEINYNSAADFDPEDWVELYNPRGNAIDISGWIFKDNHDLHEFIIPENTIIPADGYHILCRNQAAFHLIFPNVKNYSGDFDFGLDNNEETIRIFDIQGILRDSLSYRNVSPWPKAPDGSGATLALRAPNLDNSLPQNWGSSLGYGSPGAINDLNNFNSTTEVQTPCSFSLSQNYPNPFNSSTTIEYSLPASVKVKLSIYDITGREVATPVNEVLSAGSYTLTFNTSNLPSGIYFYRLELDLKVITKKMLLLK